MQNLKTVFSLTPLLLFLLCTGSLHAADGLIKEVIYNANDGKTESVAFHLNGPCLSKSFALKGENPRVVFDFLDTGLAKKVPSLILTQGTLVSRIRMGRHTNKTRVVIDLIAGGEYNFDQHFDETSNVLTIRLFSSAPVKDVKKKVVATANAAVGATVPVPDKTVKKPVKKEIKKEVKKEVRKEVKQGAGKTVKEPVKKVPAAKTTPLPEDKKPLSDPILSDVSFENTADEGEMVLFKLNGFYPPTVTGEEEGTPLVICEFAGTRLGKKVVQEQKIQGEYVKRVQVEHSKKTDMIRVTIELTASKNYDLQQVFFKEDNLFVIIVNSYESKDATAKK